MADLSAPLPPAPAPSPEALAAKKAQVARQWVAEINASEKAQRKWLERSRKISKRYRREDSQTETKRRFAMLWSNTQTLLPAIYARPPQAVVSRRFKDADPVGRLAADVLERCINYGVDKNDLDGVLKSVTLDFTLLARAQAWERYVPTFGPAVTPQIELQLKTTGEDDDEDEDEAAEPTYLDDEGKAYSGDQVQFGEDGKPFAQGEPYRPVTYEESITDYVNWEDFGHSVARTWDEVDMVWRRTYLSRAQLKKRFGDEVGSKVSLDWGGVKQGPKNVDEELTRKAAIYEIWCKSEKKVYWISKSYQDGPLDERDDPLNLEGFFPCPRPVLGTVGNDTLIPTPDFVYYQHQADEIDALTKKISELEDGLKVAGFYAGEATNNLDMLLKAANNTLIPVPDWVRLKEGGGARGLIEWWPLEQVVAAIEAITRTRQQLITDVWQITGIADVMRGMNDPRATATAESLKGQWGTLRVRDRQKEVIRFARDALRIKGEVIAEKFDVETLKLITGLQLPMAAEKAALQAQLQEQAQAAQMQAQLAAQRAQAAQMQQGPMPGGPMAGPGAPPVTAGPPAGNPPAPPGPMMGHNGGPPMPPTPDLTPEQQHILTSPTWEDVVGRLRDNAKRCFSIDIESDSTIEPNETEEKAQTVELLTALGTFIAQWGPVLQQAPAMAPMVSELLKFALRRFRVGRQLEDVIDQTMDKMMKDGAGGAQQAEQPPPDPGKMMDAQAKMQAAALKNQTDQQKLSQDAQRDQMDFQIKSADLQLKARGQEIDAAALAQDPQPQVVV